MKRMYVLASNLRNYSTPFVQAAHALAQFALEKPEKFREWNNSTLIFLSCDNIEKERLKLSRLEEDIISFHEPDDDNRLTAICLYTNKKNMGKYKLIG